MAGGIDWFRWYHGSVTDPKFQLVAKKAGAKLSDVIAVWAYLLEKASAAEFRGCFGSIDCEAVDCLFGFNEGTTDSILTQMCDRKLIADEYIVAWSERQVKRERSSDNSAERVKSFREKQRHVTPCNATVTPCNANESQETPREEKRREEVKDKESVDSSSPKEPKFSDKAWLRGHGVDEQLLADFLAMRKKKGAANTLTSFSRIKSEAEKACISVAAAVTLMTEHSWSGFKADYVKPAMRAALEDKPADPSVPHEGWRNANGKLAIRFWGEWRDPDGIDPKSGNKWSLVKFTHEKCIYPGRDCSEPIGE